MSQLVVLSQEPIWRWADCSSNHCRVYSSNCSAISSDLFPPWVNSALHLVLDSWLPIPFDCTLFAEALSSINRICSLAFTSMETEIPSVFDRSSMKSLYEIVFPAIVAPKRTGNIHLIMFNHGLRTSDGYLVHTIQQKEEWGVHWSWYRGGMLRHFLITYDISSILLLV